MHPATIDARDDDGQTVLHMTCRLQIVQEVKLLTAAGADVNCRDNKERTCLHAVFAGHIFSRDDVACVIQHLVTRPDMTPATLNAQDEAGQTALHMAYRQRNVTAVKHLTTAGADVNLRDNEGRTCFPPPAVTHHLSIV